MRSGRNKHSNTIMHHSGITTTLFQQHMPPLEQQQSGESKKQPTHMSLQPARKHVLINFFFFFGSKIVCPPALTRTYRIDVKPTKKTTPAQDNEKAQPSTTTQDSKYRIETPPAAVVAFAHRLGLNQLKDQTLLMRIVTHASYEKVGIATNERLDYLGKLTCHYSNFNITVSC